uniref:Uncharacterized protein n=1 Tax=Grammatophora oceanica TaxID=210454 RepID=A0A7S1UVK9_9STRA
MTTRNNSNDLAIGSRVVLKDLVSGKALNGRKGSIQKFVESEGRFAVKLDDARDNVLKTIKPQNLEKQSTVAVVVIPPENSMRYEEVPGKTLGGKDYEANRRFIESGRTECHTHSFRLKHLPRGKRGIMMMIMNDGMAGWDNLPVNQTMASCGWGHIREEIRGSVVLKFFYEDSESIFHLEAPKPDDVRDLLKEFAALGDPGDTRVAMDYRSGKSVTLDVTVGVVESLP